MGHKVKRLKDKKRPIIFVVESGGLCGGVRVILEYLNRGSHYAQEFRGGNLPIMAI